MSKTQTAPKANTTAAKDSAAPVSAKPETGAAAATDGKTTEGDKPAAAEVVDPFANLPVIRVGDDENVLDLSGQETSDPRKYAKVHADAVDGKLPIQRGWKYSEAVFVPGHNQGGENGFKAGSVYGTINAMVRRAGKQGISAQELVTAVRKAQIGNKRSHYCTKLPPVGWVEGWLNSAVQKNIVTLHATKKAKPLVVAAKGTESTPEQDAAAKKAANA